MIRASHPSGGLADFLRGFTILFHGCCYLQLVLRCCIGAFPTHLIVCWILFSNFDKIIFILYNEARLKLFDFFGGSSQ